MINLFIKIKKSIFEIFTRGSINGYSKSFLVIFLRTSYRFLFEGKNAKFKSNKFPIINSRKSYFLEPLDSKSFFKVSDESIKYIAYSYGEEVSHDYCINPSILYRKKYEIVQTSITNLSQYDVNPSEDCLLPIILKSHNSALTKINIEEIGVDKKNVFNVRDIPPNRVMYIRLNKNFRYSFIAQGKHDCLDVCNPYVIKKHDAENSEIAIIFFIDGFSSEIFKYISIGDLMPEVLKIVKKMNGNFDPSVAVTSDWTIPSIASSITGLMPSEHKLVDRNAYTNGKKAPTIQSIYKHNNFITQFINGNFGMSPTHGFCNDFDRSIYKHSMNSEEIISETINAVDFLPGNKKFIFASIFDLHHELKGIPDPSIQQEYSINDFDYYVDKKIKSIMPAYSPKRRNRYIQTLRKIDTHLSIIINHILNKYQSFNISIISDHGQSFISDQRSLFSPQRMFVPYFNISSRKKNKNLPLKSMLCFARRQIIDSGLSAESLLGSRFVELISKGIVPVESIVPGKSIDIRLYKGELFARVNFNAKDIESLRLEKLSRNFIRKKIKFYFQKNIDDVISDSSDSELLEEMLSLPWHYCLEQFIKK